MSLRNADTSLPDFQGRSRFHYPDQASAIAENEPPPYRTAFKQYIHVFNHDTILMPLRLKKMLTFFITHSYKAVCMVEVRSLHSGGTVCIAEAWSLQWKLGLSSKSGRLVSVQQRLMTSGGSLSRPMQGSCPNAPYRVSLR